MRQKDKTTAGLLGIFLGAYGAHHFYLGDSNKGLLYLLLSLFTGIGVLIFGIIGLVAGIKYLSMSEQEFSAMLNNDDDCSYEDNASSGVLDNIPINKIWC